MPGRTRLFFLLFFPLSQWGSSQGALWLLLFLLNGWNLQAQVNTSPWGRQRLAQHFCFPRTAGFFFFLLFTLNVQGPLASLLSQGGTAGRFLWTFLSRMCLEGASPMKPMIVMPGYTWNFITELLMAQWLQSSCQGHFPAMVCPTSWALCWAPLITLMSRPLSRAFLLLIATGGGRNYHRSLLFLLISEFSFAASYLSCPFG